MGTKSIDQKPLVLYQYENARDRDIFESQFGRDFTIIYSESDDETLRNLRQSPDCLFLDMGNLKTVLSSSIFKSPEQVALNIPLFLLGNNIHIDTIADLLKARETIKCYSKPYDSNLIRSDVFTAKVNVKLLSSSYTGVRSKNVEPAGTSDSKSPSVLIVDDESLATKYLIKQLNRINSNISVLMAENAEQALAMIHDPDMNVAVIISDQRMPGTKGNELLNEVQRSYPHIVRILTSAFQEVDVAIGAINEGRIFEYLKKPWDATQINLLISDALVEHRRYCDDLIRDENNLLSEHQRVIEQRQDALRAEIVKETNGPFCIAVLEEFFILLSSMTSTKITASKLRANKEMDLDVQIVSNFKDELAFWLRDMEGLKLLDDNSKDRIKTEIARLLQLELDDNDSDLLSSDLDDSERQLVLYTLSVLDVLLTSSNLDRSAFELLTKECGAEVLTMGLSKIKVFVHLLSPISSVTKSLLEHQSALYSVLAIHSLLGDRFQWFCVNDELKIEIYLGNPEGGSRELI